MSHKLFIHEQGVLPDGWNLFDDAIDIYYGKRHDIALGAGVFQTTKNFRDLKQEIRRCHLPEEAHMIKNKVAFRKYSTTNCIADHLIRQIFAKCQCYPWDLASYLNIMDKKARQLLQRQTFRKNFILSFDIPDLLS